MSILRNLFLTLCMLGFTFAVTRISSVSAQVGVSCCATPHNDCTTLVQTNYNNCQNNCAQAYGTSGDAYTNCINSCKSQRDQDKITCDGSFSGCLSTGTSWCHDSVCPNTCGPGNDVVYVLYTDDCTQPYCTCTCHYSGCYGAPPACPNPSCYNGTWVCNSPVLVDVDGEGFHLTNVADGVFFDFFGTHTKERISWTDPSYHNAWLVLDRNENGIVDSAEEMFGNTSPQPASNEPNGYLALAEYDKLDNGGNGDGFIGPRDTIYSQLRLWIDINHDGISQPTELHRLPEYGIARLDLQYEDSRRTDQYGNAFRYRARVWDIDDRRQNRWTYDVFLQLSQQ